MLLGTHVLDGGYVDADLLVRGRNRTRSADWSAVRVLQPAMAGRKGDNLQAFVIDWQAGRRAVSQGCRQHSLATWATMCRGIPSFASGLTGCAAVRALALLHWQAILNRGGGVRASSRTSTTTRKGYGCVRADHQGHIRIPRG